jgi:hypothetical protein
MMRIGIDFDNTIACYEGVFHKAALERGLISTHLPASKNAVRDYLNGSGRKDEFTLLQGYVYGARMDLVSPYPGLVEFLHRARSERHQMFIISHKTRHPILGPPHDMHAAAHGFLKAKTLSGPSGVATDNIYFEVTKAEKVARIVGLHCDVFIDDLPEILSTPGLSSTMRRILFDPTDDHAKIDLDPTIERHRSWAEISSAIFGDDGIPSERRP